jgi:hypothetical protein
VADNKVTIEFEVTGNTKQKLDDIANSSKNLEESFKSAFTGASKSFEVFKGTLGAEAVIKGFELVTDAAKELFDVIITDGVKAAIAEENAIATLNGTLAANGNYSKKASKDVIEFAEALEKTTKFSNDAVVGAAGLLEGLTKLDVNGLKKATQGAADLAALFNTDLGTAANAIGKAFEGSTRGLKQFGIEITATNNKALLQQQILSALAAKQGAAALQSNTFSGATAQLANSFDNFVKQIGFAITQNPVFIAVLKQLSKTFGDLEKYVQGNKEAITGFINDGIKLVIDNMPLVIFALSSTAKILNILYTGFTVIGFAVTSFVAGMIQAIEPVVRFAAQITNSKGLLESYNIIVNDSFKLNGALGESALKVEERFKAVDDISKTATETLKGFSDSINKAKDNSNTMSEALDKQSSSYVKLTEEQQKNIDAGVALDAQLSTTQTQLEIKSALLTAQHDSELISDQEFYAQKQALLDQQFSEESVKLTAAYQQGLIGHDKYNQDQLLLDKKKNAAQLQLQKAHDDKTIQQRDSFLSLASTLQRAKSQELVAIGKAAAITQIAIDTPKAVSGAFAFGSSLAGPALGFTHAAIAATAEAALAAQVAGVGLANGIDSVPGTGNRDNFPAVLAPGERVIPRSSNQDLKSFLSDASGMTAVLQSIDNKLGQLQNSTIVNIGSKNIVNELRDAMAGGRVINV